MPDPSILSFYTAYKSGSWQQQGGEIIPNVIVLSYVKVLLGDPEVLPSQIGHVICHAYYGSATRSQSIGHTRHSSIGRHIDQVPDSPHPAPFKMKELQF